MTVCTVPFSLFELRVYPKQPRLHFVGFLLGMLSLFELRVYPKQPRLHCVGFILGMLLLLNHVLCCCNW